MILFSIVNGVIPGVAELMIPTITGPSIDLHSSETVTKVRTFLQTAAINRMVLPVFLTRIIA